MIVVRLIGGLGNQMFQYAAAKSLAIKNNVSLALDLSAFAKQKSSEVFTKRDFALGHFDINTFILKNNEFDYLFQNGFPGKLKKFLSGYHYYYDYNLSYYPTFFDLKKKTYLEGYFQSEKYFSGIRPQLLKDFTVGSVNTSNPLFNQIKNCESVAIHLRRGDFSEKTKIHERHGTCSLEYYQEAINMINTRISSPLFFVFSDDISWAKKSLNNMVTDCIFVEPAENKTYVDDFLLMKACQHHIIANSTFSWWAAWLNENDRKMVIAPEKWLNDNTIDTSDVIPQSWIKI